MKKYRQLVQELPSKKVVMAFGRFQPPTNSHELLINAVKKIAQKQDADHVIFASNAQDKKLNPLSVDRKVYYLNKMFPRTNFVAANEQIQTFIEAASALSKKYKHLVMLAGSDKVAEYTKALEKHNGTFKFETIEVVSAGQRDPDADTKMRDAAKKGDYQLFKKGLPRVLTDIDGKRLMNEIRQGLGLEAIKEQVKFERNELREKYHAGEIFKIGDKVTDGEVVYEVVDRGANYITVVNESGSISKKWLDSVQPTQIEEDILPGPAPEEISFKGYKTKNLHHSEDATKAFQTTIQRYDAGQITDAVAILNALKATDTYMKINDLHLEQGEAPDKADLAVWREAHEKARESLNRIGEFMHHLDYWHMHEHEIQGMETKYTPATQGADISDSVKLEGQLIEMKFNATDKIKVARVIASSLGLEDVEKSSNAEQLINNALRKVRSKPMRPEYVQVLHKMLQTAKEADIKYDEKLVPQKVSEASDGTSREFSAVEKNKLGMMAAMIAREREEKQARDAAAAKKKPKLKKEDHELVLSILEAIANAKLLGKDSMSLEKKLTQARMPHNEPDADDLGGTPDSDADNMPEPMTKIGSVMASPGEDDHLRKMKVKYRTEAVDDTAKAAKEVEKANLVAKHAKEKEDLTKKQQSENERIAEAACDKKMTKEALGTEDIPDEEKEKKLGLTSTVSEETEDEANAKDFDLDFDDKDIEELVNSINTEDDILEAYDDEELSIIDDDTGEHIDDLKEEALDEVLSRSERIKAKTRFAKSSAKRQRKTKIAIKSHSSAVTINKRARRLAVELMKQRIAKKPLNKLSIGEKERLEKIISSRKVLLNRLAMKLAPRIRKIESQRLTHKNYTK